MTAVFLLGLGNGNGPPHGQWVISRNQKTHGPMDGIIWNLLTGIGIAEAFCVNDPS